jgi:hypothetical protein
MLIIIIAVPLHLHRAALKTAIPRQQRICTTTSTTTAIVITMTITTILPEIPPHMEMDIVS